MKYKYIFILISKYSSNLSNLFDCITEKRMLVIELQFVSKCNIDGTFSDGTRISRLDLNLWRIVPV